MNIGQLYHGGFHLIYERENDAIELQGRIEEISGLNSFKFPKLKSEYGYGDPNGVQFTINGVNCTAITKGQLNIGDYVSVVYLPQSGYVLSIAQMNEYESKTSGRDS